MKLFRVLNGKKPLPENWTGLAETLSQKNVVNSSVLTRKGENLYAQQKNITPFLPKKI